MNNGMQGFSRRMASSGIKSIQRGTISVAGSTSSGTATISAVDPNKSTIEPLGVSGSGSASADDFAFRVTLTSATTVTANRAAAPVATAVVGFQVVEYY